MTGIAGRRQCQKAAIFCRSWCLWVLGYWGEGWGVVMQSVSHYEIAAYAAGTPCENRRGSNIGA